MKESAILRTLAEHTRSVVKLAHAVKRSSNTIALAGAERVQSFFVALVLELADSAKEDHLRILLTYVNEGLAYQSNAKAGVMPFKRGCTMMVAQLSRVLSLAAAMVRSLMKPLIASLTASSDVAEAEETALAICIILTFQKVILCSSGSTKTMPLTVTCCRRS